MWPDGTFFVILGHDQGVAHCTIPPFSAAWNGRVSPRIESENDHDEKDVSAPYPIDPPLGRNRHRKAWAERLAPNPPDPPNH
jgi:hypothetical protein